MVRHARTGQERSRPRGGTIRLGSNASGPEGGLDSRQIVADRAQVTLRRYIP